MKSEKQLMLEVFDIAAAVAHHIHEAKELHDAKHIADTGCHHIMHLIEHALREETGIKGKLDVMKSNEHRELAGFLAHSDAKN